MSTILKFILGYILDYLKDLVVGYVKKQYKKKEVSDDIDAKRAEVIKLLQAAPRGKLMSEEQRKVLYASYRNLARR